MDIRFCAECGSGLDSNGCCPNPSCLGNAPAGSIKSKNSPFQSIKFAEKEKNIVPDCVEPDLDEVPIKQYDIARLQTLIKGAFAEGRLQITNKRVLFRSAGNSILGPTSLQYEFSLEEIAGIEIRKEARFNFFSSVILLLLTLLINSILSPLFAPVYSWKIVSTVFAIVLAVASVFLFFLLKDKKVLRHLILSVVLSGFVLGASTFKQLTGTSVQSFMLKVALIVYIINFLYLAFAPNLVVNIKTKGGTPSVEIRRKDGFFSFQHNEYTGFAQVIPGPDTDAAMKEIGALIREVQQTGAYTEK